MDIKGTYCGGYGTNKQTVRRYDHRPPTAADIREAIHSQLDKMRVFAWYSGGDPRELADLHASNELTRLVERVTGAEKPSCNLAPGA